MGITLMILGFVLIAMGLVLTLALPIAGILAALFGVVFVVYGRKVKSKKTEHEEKHEEEPEIEMMEQYLVAGFDYYQDELKEFLTEPNDEYNSKDIDREYEYFTEWETAELKEEPDNEFDSGAIAVYVQGVKIGYVAKKNQAALRGVKTADVEIFGGKYRQAVFDEYGEFEKIETGESPYKAMLYIKSRK